MTPPDPRDCWTMVVNILQRFLHSFLLLPLANNAVIVVHLRPPYVPRSSSIVCLCSIHVDVVSLWWSLFAHREPLAALFLFDECRLFLFAFACVSLQIDLAVELRLPLVGLR